MTFDKVAESYHQARPSFPEEMFDRLVQHAALKPGARLLEVGCGTGRATLPLARRGYHIVGLEIGADLAAVARRNLTSFPQVQVVNAPFEDWEPDGQRFDLVYAADAWHWLDSNLRYHRTADALEPGGRLAIVSGGHAFPADVDPFFFDVQDVYRKLGMQPAGEAWPPPLPDDVPDMRGDIEASGLFRSVQVSRFVWELTYTADEYIGLLDTFSGHIALEAEKRAFLYRNIRERIERRPGARVRRHWLAILNVARRYP